MNWFESSMLALDIFFIGLVIGLLIPKKVKNEIRRPTNKKKTKAAPKEKRSKI
jgi:hypothetical protein